MFELITQNFFKMRRNYGMLITILSLLSVMMIVTAKPKGVTTIDELRSHYIDILEKSLWDYLGQRNETKFQLKKVFESHRIFASQNLKENFPEDRLFPLRRYYEWNILENDLKHIDGLFEYFRTFVNNYAGLDYDDRATLDLVETVLQDKKLSIPAVFRSIDNIMVKQTLYYRAISDSNDQICATKQSPQQFLFSLYSDISLTELKGYAMLQFSWMILTIYEKGNYTHEAELMRNNFQERTTETQRIVREVMRRADRTLWTCDPNRYIKGETYDEVTRLLQGYIENEVDMNPDQTCRENCGHYGVAKSHGCFKDLYCSRQARCTGQLYNCQYFDSDMWICPASDKSNRRYEYIEYESGRVLGKAGTCARGTSKVDSWWRWLFWHCSYCFCLCDEQGIKSDRYFNLRETKSNTEANMVVTGLRFVKKNRIFHLQIQEGELMKRGNINTSTLKWKPVEEYKIFDSGVKSGVDYHTMNWNSRAMDLDDLTTDDPMYIVTGVKFRVVGVHLNLEIRLTEFNFETGKLLEPEKTSFWKSNDNTDLSEEKRTEIKLVSPDLSTNSIVKSSPKSRHNQYINFVNTNMDKDAAQSTVPFVDIQEVVSSPPVPLSGVGIYHKGMDQFGGFVAPKLITYDFSPHIQSPKFNERK